MIKLRPDCKFNLAREASELFILREALEAAQGNKREAANKLEISPSMFFKRLKFLEDRERARGLRLDALRKNGLENPG